MDVRNDPTPGARAGASGTGVMQAANVALRFALELCALAAFGYWGAHTGTGPLSKTLLSMVAVVAGALVWGAFCSPKARVPLARAPKLAVQGLVLAAAVVALASTGHPAVAAVLAVLATGNAALLAHWRQ